MKRYDHRKIEKKWQKVWKQERFYRAKDFAKKKKFYTLVEFPYPSGEGLHVGHVRSYAAIDAVARFHRMKGENVLYPIGFDAFGLPTENFAIKNKLHPRLATDRNIKNFTRQLKSLGLSFDWSRVIDTTDPKYYKWTQWIFLKLYEAGLAYRAEIPINWCPKCKIGLANEEVINGRHERCGTEVVKKLMTQWVIKITRYTDRLIDDLKLVDYPERVKTQQVNWIGRSEGAEIVFPLDKKFKYVLLHGFTGGPDNNFFPWLKQELQKRGHRVTVPTLPNTDHPTEQEQVDYVVRHVTFDANTILFGHSLGGPVAMKVLEKLGHPIAGLVLAGGFLKPHFKDHDRPYEHDFSWEFDLEKIKSRVGFVKVLSDRNDYAVPLSSGRELAAALGGELIETVGASEHFCNKEEPVILENLMPAIKVFTTRPDTLFGATYLVLAPEHPAVAAYLKEKPHHSGVWNIKEVAEYVQQAKKKTDIARTAAEKAKTGVELKGFNVIHPFTGEKLPVWTADYVLASYGSGAIMAVPSHDERDFAFAKKYKLPIKLVIKPPDVATRDDLPPPASSLGHLPINLEAECWVGEGTLINSGPYSGLDSQKARRVITSDLQKKGLGKAAVSYKLRDWIFSRQHYWGEPIPIVYCDRCGEVPVPEKQLPVKLPNVKRYEPTDTGESPLAAIKSFVNTKCPICRGPARRETDTMPNWAGSNWYFIRYVDPKNSREFAARKKMDYWLPVDLYNGGMEHTTLHLLYSRFIYKFLYDQKLVPGPEPYAKRTSHGVILAEDGRKMSKSFGNVINPDDIVKEYGADTLRMYEMFLAPFDQMVPWDSRGVVGVRRFIERVYRLFNSKIKNQNAKLQLKVRNDQSQRVIHHLIKKVTADLLEMKFNTAVSAFMETLNALERLEEIPKSVAETYVVLLAPFAPHLAEELWAQLGHKKSVHLEAWPVHDEKYIVDDTIKIPVQVNGKVRDIITVPADMSQNEITNQALNSPKVEAHINGKTIVRTVYVPRKLVNFVVR